jgi:hypothetical protein
VADITLTPKKPTEKVAYVSDWRLQLDDGDSLLTSTVAVTSGTVTITLPTYDDTTAFFVVSGGANAETAVLTNTVTTVGGQTLIRTLSLLISSTSQPIVPSTVTKRVVVNMAFEEIGLAGYEFDATPEEQASAVRRLDALLNEWNGPGVNMRVPYAFPATLGSSNLDDASGLPDFCINTVAISLALRIAPAIGKSLSAETRLALNAGMNSLRAAYTVIPTMQLPASTPRGAGWKPNNVLWPFVGSNGSGGQGSVR